MNLGKKGRHGHVKRRTSTNAAATLEAEASALAIVPEAEAANLASPPEDAVVAAAPEPSALPAVAAPPVPAPEPVVEVDYSVPRRSFFDLLSQKYPDLAPPENKNKKAPAAPAPKAAPAAPARVESAAAPKPAAAPPPKPEPVVAAKPEPVVAAKPEPVVAAKPEPVAPPKPEPVAAAKPEPVVLPKPEPVVAAKPEPVVAAKPEPVAAAKPEPVVHPKPEPVAAPKPEPVAAAKPEPVVAAKPEPVVAPKPEPVAPPKPEPVAVAKPESVAPPKPAPPEPVVPPPAVASAPPAPVAGATAARTGRATTRGGPSKKVLLFWAGLVALLGVGAYALTKLKPTLAPTAGQGQEGAAVPVDSAAGALSARGLSLEPEKVVVPLPGTGASAPKPPASETKKPEPKKPEAKKADAKKTDAKKTEKPRPESQIVIEQVPPVVPPVRKGGNQPEYPLEARAAGVEGTVVLFGIIGRDGKIKNARVVRGLSPPLDAAALAAFKTWRFEPATQKGKKVEFKYNAGIEFRINSPAAQVAAPPLVEPAPAAAAPPAASSTAGGAAPLPYGGDFTPPVRTTMVWPQKPEGAQMVKGEVKLQLTVAANGSVTSVEVLEGLPQGVTEAAIEAVRQWKFKPARRNGEPVVVYHRVSLRF